MDGVLCCVGFFACDGGVANCRASTPFVPGAGIAENGMAETSSGELDKANGIIGEEPDAAMQEGGKPVVEPAESGPDQLQPQIQNEAPRASVKTLLDGDLIVYLDEVPPPLLMTAKRWLLFTMLSCSVFSSSLPFSHKLVDHPAI